MPLRRASKELPPPLRRPHRTVGVFPVWQALARRVAGNAREYEPLREIEHIVRDPGQVLFWTVLEHVGSDHPVEPACRKRGKWRVARIVAVNVVHVPVFLDAFEPTLARDDYVANRVLPAFSASVVENIGRAGSEDERPYARCLGKKALSCERFAGGYAEKCLTFLVHLPIEVDKVLVTPTRRSTGISHGPDPTGALNDQMDLSIKAMVNFRSPLAGIE